MNASHDAIARRMHPAAAAIDFIRRAPASWGSITALVLISSREAWLASIAAGIFASLSALLAFARWRAFTYRLDAANGLVIEQGLLRRHRRAIPRERIEDISTEQGPLQRLFRLVRVRVETGGGLVDEGLLDSVSKAEALRLQTLLRGSAAGLTASDGAIAVAPLFAMTAGRVFRHGLFSFSLLWLAAILAAFKGVERVTRVNLSELVEFAEHEAAARFSFAAVLLVVGLVLTLGVGTGIVTSFLRDFGFRLTFAEGQFRRIRGLLTRSQTIIANRRIQLALIRRGWLSGRWGFAALEVQTLGGSDGPSGRHDLAPFATRAEIDAILAETQLPPFEPESLATVSPAHAVLWLLRKMAVWVVIIAVAGWFWPPVWAGLLMAPIMAMLAWYQPRYHRYALRGTSLQVTSGVVRACEWIAPYPALQAVTVRRTLLQRCLGVASVLVNTAGARGTLSPDVHDIPTDAARLLASGLIARAGP